ncbi:hypothetical protein [Alloyangia pacifica]|uniref:Type II toxin-antitoxin system HicB family antitoxin n=1 Tax=Alloyangia pacifica TaxID=311180 RepID=A0A1I6QLN6_9RHOB|nr:hypothetical protein [Alloyangia pacifica]SDF92287.1 hypothetical protein SAMN04488245_101144 [Alloyangia pacifica]SFS53168.1 hypothetical protein SAMN04488050_102145 [Alloyangia pacifica]
MAQRETVTITKKDGEYQAKLHGFPMWFTGPTYEAALTRAGQFLDESAARSAEIMDRLEKKWAADAGTPGDQSN